MEGESSGATDSIDQLEASTEGFDPGGAIAPAAGPPAAGAAGGAYPPFDPGPIGEGRRVTPPFDESWAPRATIYWKPFHRWPFIESPAEAPAKQPERAQQDTPQNGRSLFDRLRELDTTLRQRDVDRFLLPIQDVFSIWGRGTVVTGRAEAPQPQDSIATVKKP